MKTVEQAWDELVARRGGAVWQLVCTDVREAFREGWTAAMEDVNELLTEQAMKVRPKLEITGSNQGESHG